VHHVHVEDCASINHDGSQQTSAISTKTPTWAWEIRRNVIRDAGTGMYLLVVIGAVLTPVAWPTKEQDKIDGQLAAAARAYRWTNWSPPNKIKPVAWFNDKVRAMDVTDVPQLPGTPVGLLASLAVMGQKIRRQNVKVPTLAFTSAKDTLIRRSSA